MKRGFTLVELLGVIVILSLLTLLTFPSILNYIKKGNDSIDETTEKLIYSAAKTYIKDNQDDYPKEENTYCISIDKLIDSNNLKESTVSTDIIQNKIVKVIYKNGYNYSVVDVDECSETYIMKIDLPTGLTPVKYENGNWIVTTKNDSDWFDYENQKWANAVVLEDGVTKSKGDIVNVDGSSADVEAKAMFVYIPRYEYKIVGTYGTHLDGTAGTSTLPGEINVKFIYAKQTTADDGYIIHPAFTFGEKELEGFWMSKFEIGHKTLSSSSTENNLECTEESCSNAAGIISLPNVTSLRYNSISNFFYAIRKISDIYNINRNSHMIKNSEWGAAAYLSQSVYGKYGNDNYSGTDKEVYKGAGNTTGNSWCQPIYNQSKGIHKYDVFTNNCGIGASTTGTIYGVYGMNGGSFDTVMGVYNKSISSSGFSTLPDEKYYNNYDKNGLCSSQTCFGHAFTEVTSWYEDAKSYAYNTSNSWYHRGGLWTSTSGGVFYADVYGGKSTSYISTRIILSQE